MAVRNNRLIFVPTLKQNNIMKKNVKTRKQLEQEGLARIESNFGQGWCYLDESYKWVLIINDDDFVFKQEGNTLVVGMTIKELIDVYNEGIVSFKEFYNE